MTPSYAALYDACATWWADLCDLGLSNPNPTPDPEPDPNPSPNPSQPQP